MKPETAWKWMPAGLLFATVIFAVWRIQLAVGDPHFAAVDNYYQAAEGWDFHMEEVRASEALNWDVRLQPIAADPQGEKNIVFLVVDAEGKPLEGVTGQMVAFHNAYPKESFDRVLSSSQSGQLEATLPLTRAGLWRWKLRLQHGEETWVGDLRFPVDRPKPGVSG
ncbi:MAG: FixH family protein [Planctomycetota bacterium]